MFFRTLAKVAWRFYKFRCFVEMAEAALDNGSKSKFYFFQELTRKREARCLAVDLSTALWQWRQVKLSTDTASASLEKEWHRFFSRFFYLKFYLKFAQTSSEESSTKHILDKTNFRHEKSVPKEFLVDDTAITTTHISRKLDSLENLVRRTGFNNRKKSSHHRILAHDLLKNPDRDLESGEMLNQRKTMNWFSGLSSGFNRIMDRTSSLKSSMHGYIVNYLIYSISVKREKWSSSYRV